MVVIVAVAGIIKPKVEDDFATLGFANEAMSWKNYVYTANLKTDSNVEA
jgi:hypothetical protein